MQPKEFLKKLQNYLKKLKEDTDINGWKFQGKTNIAYGSPGGSWNPKDFAGYKFSKENKIYILRPAPERNTIAIESISEKKQVVNFNLSDKTFKEDGNSIVIYENYIMTVKVKIKSDIVKKAMYRADFPTDNIILKFNVSSLDFDTIISKFFKWADIREKARNIIRTGKIPEYEPQKIGNSQGTQRPNSQIHLNQILFGPPGTGKTYHTMSKAVEIANPEFNIGLPRKEVKQEYEKLVKEGRVVFTTFHQSMCYEDFVEGIKPVMSEMFEEDTREDYNLKYKICDGIFKRIVSLAGASQIISSQGSGYQLPKEILSKLDSINYGKIRHVNWNSESELYQYCIENECICINYNIDMDFSEHNSDIETEKILKDLNQGWHEKVAIKTLRHWLSIDDIVFVVSSGKSIIRSIAQIKGDYFFNPNAPIPCSHFRKVKWLLKDVNIPVEKIYETDFSSYEASLLYNAKVKKDFFFNPKSVESQNHVLIIDEINRGNVAGIFGELITLIEKDKRAGMDEAIEVVLPYSKEKFSVPQNLHIIGTMNTADRSIEALDTALRRRFVFEELSPNPSLIAEVGSLEKTGGKIGEIDVVQILETINKRIEKLIDKDHMIGHSYFLKIETEEDLIHCFKNQVIPLLEEYFFGDFGKIGLVLGDSFIEKQEKFDKEFANFEGYDPSVLEDLNSRPVFKYKDSSEWNFESIYSPKS